MQYHRVTRRVPLAATTSFPSSVSARSYLRQSKRKRPRELHATLRGETRGEIVVSPLRCAKWRNADRFFELAH